jgi:hypothetical protein
LILLLTAFTPLCAQEPQRGDETEVWLVTYGPGEVYWQRFGHNAIWIRDPGLGLDHVFNFGFFDFEQQDFFLRFLQGRMMYFSAARPARDEFAAYVNENRSIRGQRLDLSSEQKLGLIDYLLEEVRPENRDYLYDYYNNNCSTRIRDAIDTALGGIIRQEFQPLEAQQSWRDHTRRLTAADFWLYLGLETGLGSPVDDAGNQWDEMFIPGQLADKLGSAEFTGAATASPLVLEDVLLYRSTLDPPSATPPTLWPRYLLASVVLLAAAWLSSRFVPAAWVRVVCRCWLVLSGTVGLVLLFLWFGTDHAVARYNVNLLVFCPLWIFLAFWKGRELFVLQLVAVISVAAILISWLPPYQYNLDVLAAFLPLNLAAALGLFRFRFPAAGPPGVPASGDR